MEVGRVEGDRGMTCPSERLARLEALKFFGLVVAFILAGMVFIGFIFPLGFHLVGAWNKYLDRVFQ